MNESLGGILEILKKVNNYFDKAYLYDATTSSLVSKTQLVRVEPLYVIDTTLKASDVLQDLSNTMLTMFAGFYIQAVAQSNAQAEMRIHEKLEALNPDTNWLLSARMKYLAESSKIKSGYNPFLKTHTGEISTEAIVTQSDKKIDTSYMLRDFKEAYQLAVGKIITINFKKLVKYDNNTQIERSLDVPIGIRLLAGYCPSNIFVDIFSFGSKNQTASDRRLSWKLGELSFIKDILLCRDIYRNARKTLYRDKTGYFRSMLDRQNNSVLYKLIMRGQHAGGISTLVAISDTTLRAIEENIGIKLDDFRARDKIFHQTGTMVLAIVDENYRVVKFYFHSVENPLIATYKDLKKSGKKDGMDVSDLVQALSMGNAPRL